MYYLRFNAWREKRGEHFYTVQMSMDAYNIMEPAFARNTVCVLISRQALH